MSPPSSTGATNGSIKNSTYSKSSKSKATSKSTTNSNDNSKPSSSLSKTSLPSGSPDDLSEEHKADYLANTVDPVPSYQYTSTEESVHAHKTSMKSYLDDFDNNMLQYEA